MANELSQIRELWVDEEGTFSTDPSTDGSGFTRIPAEAIEWTPAQEMIERSVQRSGLGKRIPAVIGGKGGQVKFKTPLYGAATAGAATVAAVAPVWFTALMKGCGYSEFAGTGTAVIASPSGTTTTTVLEVDSAAGLTQGQFVMVGGEVRQVTATNTAGTDTITVAPALSSTPAGATVVYAAVNYILNGGVDGGTTVAFVAKLHGSQDTILGCKGTFSIGSTDARGRPMVDWTFEVDTWAGTSNKSSLPTTLGLKSDGLMLGAPFWLGSTKTPVANFGFDPGHVVTAKAGTEGTQGRVGYVITDENAKATVGVYLNESTLRTAFATPTLQRALMQVGSTAANVFAIGGDQAQISFPGNDDIGGMRGHNLELMFRESAISGGPNVVVAVL